MNGWLVLSDITSKDDGLQIKTHHSQRMYRPEDYKKIDDYCLQVHKEFNAERDKERKRLEKEARKAKKEAPSLQQKDDDLKSAGLRQALKH
jgi:regulator of protease activity HflC (stomatin/prohibitin superfamily)